MEDCSRNNYICGHYIEKFYTVTDLIYFNKIQRTYLAQYTSFLKVL